ncbi:MAG: sulfite exporter TauE/SafE family protein [Elusimicrobia bacterium]|nr:sulfite exporter TauE/SafE family protein [Elusimicrobiota bacterium]
MFTVVCVVALGASLLTFFSGFGLGTLLLPAFAAFFPVDAAIAMTAVVHFSNNIFKLILVGRKADLKVAARFGLPAIAASFIGAKALLLLTALPELSRYGLWDRTFHVTWVNLVIAGLMLAFAALEAFPSMAGKSFDRKHLPLGGVLSGFFGGLSGHQGAFRSAFLMRCGLDQQTFVATGVVVACLVDATRLTVYASRASSAMVAGNVLLIAAAMASAFLGAWLGARLIKKVKLRTLQILVSCLLALFAACLAAGLV